MSYRFFNAGKFISRGKGIHPERVIESDELIYVLRGELMMFEEDRQFQLHPGDYLILHRGKKHGGLAAYPRNLIFFWIHFLDDGIFLHDLPQCGRTVGDSALPNYVQAFLNEQARLDHDRTCMELLFELIFRELRRSSHGQTATEHVTPLAGAAERFLHLHYTEPITLCDVSRELHCNPAYLGKIFHHAFHESVSGKLNRMRIAHAMQLLSESSLSIKEIVSRCGFNDPAYFRRQFYRFCSMTPGEYRRNGTKEHLNTL